MNEALPSCYYDRPALVVDPGFHIAPIYCADAASGLAVTGSHDKTVRVFDLADGRLTNTIRLPAGPGHIGKVFAVAICPEGKVIAASGFTDAPGHKQKIYLFESATGSLIKHLHGLPQVAHGLAFSPNGRFLAAVLGEGFGMRVFDRTLDWEEVGCDLDYGKSSYNLAFASDGRVATTSEDGLIRLYNSEFQRIKTLQAPQGEPFGISFEPSGDRLAVGYCDTLAVSLLDGETLAPLTSPDTTNLTSGDLLSVAWCASGRRPRANITN